MSLRIHALQISVVIACVHMVRLLRSNDDDSFPPVLGCRLATGELPTAHVIRAKLVQALAAAGQRYHSWLFGNRNTAEKQNQRSES